MQQFPAGPQAVPVPIRQRLTAGSHRGGQRHPTPTGALTFQVPPLVVEHDVLAVEHLVADLTGELLVPVLLLVLGEVAVGGEEPEAHLTLECLVICRGGSERKQLLGT